MGTSTSIVAGDDFLNQLRQKNIDKLSGKFSPIPSAIIPAKRGVGSAVRMTKPVKNQDDLEFFVSMT